MNGMTDRAVQTTPAGALALGLGTQPGHDTAAVQALVEAAQQGDRAAFDELTRLYQPRIYRHCLRITKNPELSQDLTQEVLLRVYMHLQRFMPTCAFYTWVYRITANCCIDHFRRSKREPQELGVTADLEAGDWLDQLFADRGQDADSPEEVLLNKELHGELRRAIRGLTPVLREVTLLGDIKGYRDREVSKLVGCDVGTVKSRTFRARRRLREQLQPYLS